MGSDDTSQTPAVSETGTAFHDAALGQRVGALLLDTIIVMVPLFVVAALLFGQSETSGSGFRVSLNGVPFLLTTLVALAYFIGLELAGGQTLGKKIVGIRVVSERGAVGVGAAVLRNLLRVIDGLFFYLVGFLVALASKKNQRLGDMAASTRVVKAR